jgi:hypothetical protein
MYLGSKPRFERNRCTERTVPRTFLELEACWRQGRCRPFDERGNPEGHASTGFAEWQRTPSTRLRPLPCLRSSRFEPYLVLPAAPTTPLYDEAFQGYGKNKIQHTVHLLAAGFAFSVLSRGFLVHFPHPPSSARLVWDVAGVAADLEPYPEPLRLGTVARVPSQRASNNALYLRFLAWLSTAYGGRYGGADELTRGQVPDPGHASGGASGSGASSSFVSSDGDGHGDGDGAAKIRTPLSVTHICEGTTEHMTRTERDRLKRKRAAAEAKQKSNEAVGSSKALAGVDGSLK